MNIDRLKYFVAVVETKSLRRAADLVGITPGSMSKAISLFELELGVELIRPEGRGIEITAEGLRIYNASAPLLDEVRRFMSYIKQTPTNTAFGKLRIGTFEVFSSYFLAAFLAKEFPERDALLLEFTPGNIEKAIEEDLVDFGLTYLPSPSTKLEFTEIGSFKMGIFGLKSWEHKSFDSWPFAAPTTALKINSLAHISLDMWPQTTARLIKYEFELLETALQTSRMGLSVLHCPSFIITFFNRHVLNEYKLVNLPYPESYKNPEKIKIYLVSKKGNMKTKLIEGKLAKFLRFINIYN